MEYSRAKKVALGAQVLEVGLLELIMVCARTNYGMFNIRFKGPKVWNDLDENIKGFSLSAFKNKLKQNFLESY